MASNYPKSVSLLSSLGKSGRMPHAFLFTGIDKSEKIRVAYELSKWVLSDHAKDFTNFFESGCSCPSCNQVNSGVHPDFFQLKKDGISIADILELKRKMSLAPFSSSKKAALIENAESLRREGANALLKLLEEPKGEVVIILVVQARSSILDTISSRCAEIKFASPSLDLNTLYSKEIIDSNTDFIDIFENEPLFKKFAVAKQYSLKNKGELIVFINIWMARCRRGFLEGGDNKQAVLAKKLLEVKRVVLNTNANPQLLLEELALDIF